MTSSCNENVVTTASSDYGNVNQLFWYSEDIALTDMVGLTFIIWTNWCRFFFRSDSSSRHFTSTVFPTTSTETAHSS